MDLLWAVKEIVFQFLLENQQIKWYELLWAGKEIVFQWLLENQLIKWDESVKCLYTAEHHHLSLGYLKS